MHVFLVTLYFSNQFYFQTEATSLVTGSEKNNLETIYFWNRGITDCQIFFRHKVILADTGGKKKPITNLYFWNQEKISYHYVQCVIDYRN
jgi:hypothetical protein